MHISSLYRYPVKGLSAERLTSVRVVQGRGFPCDRMYGLLRTDAGFDPVAPTWLAKANFVMLMLYEELAYLKTRFSPSDKALYVCTLDGRECVFRLETDAGRAALEQFFFDFMPNRLSIAPRLVVAQGHQFTDKAEQYLSLINLASLRELEQQWGQSLDPLRFRANVYIDNAEPFSELEWVGQELRLGNVATTVERRNGRCAATNVNPKTGVRDRDVPGKLRAAFGHKDLGVYLRVAGDGLICEGDSVQLTSPGCEPVHAREITDLGVSQLICIACYYLFDPRSLHADCNGDETAQALVNAIGQLPAPQREAFLLKEEAGLSLDDIAAVVGSPREAIKSRLRYATRKLRELLSETYP